MKEGNLPHHSILKRVDEVPSIFGGRKKRSRSRKQRDVIKVVTITTYKPD